MEQEMSKPYAIVDLKTNTVVRRFANVVPACECADRKGAGFKMGFVYADGTVRDNGVVLAKVAQ